MSVEASIYTVLSAVCLRTFPDVAPTSTERPYVTYTQIGGQVIQTLGGDVPDKINGEFQINVWADTRAEASALAHQIEAAMRQANTFAARPLGAFASDYDHDMQLYGARQDFSVWSSRE